MQTWGLITAIAAVRSWGSVRDRASKYNLFFRIGIGRALVRCQTEGEMTFGSKNMRQQQHS